MLTKNSNQRMLRFAATLLIVSLICAICAPSFAQAPAVPAKAAPTDKPSADAAGPEPKATPPKAGATDPKAADQKFDEMMNKPDAKADKSADTNVKPQSVNGWELFKKGGFVMWPIAAMSVIAIIFAVERTLGLRRSLNLPPKLVEAFGELSASPTGLDLRKAYRLTQQFPSTASNVVRSMLLKAGRPQPEVEAAVDASLSRESTRLSTNLRPMILTVTVTPLMGLLGTVYGMIIVFQAMATMAPGADKATALADGIYAKLMTTFAGLAVAIPALIIAHYLEGRVQARIREIAEFVNSLLPQVEKYEGKLRVNRQQLSGAEPGAAKAAGKEPRRAAGLAAVVGEPAEAEAQVGGGT